MPYILSRGEARELLAVIPGFPWLVASSRLTYESYRMIHEGDVIDDVSG